MQPLLLLTAAQRGWWVQQLVAKLAKTMLSVHAGRQVRAQGCGLALSAVQPYATLHGAWLWGLRQLAQACCSQLELARLHVQQRHVRVHHLFLDQEVCWQLHPICWWRGRTALHCSGLRKLKEQKLL